MQYYLDAVGNIVDSNGNSYSQYSTDGQSVFDQNGYNIGSLANSSGAATGFNAPIASGSIQQVVSTSSITPNNQDQQSLNLASIIAASAGALNNTILAAQGKPIGSTVISPVSGVNYSGTSSLGNLTSNPIMLILLVFLGYLLYKHFA